MDIGSMFRNVMQTSTPAAPAPGAAPAAPASPDARGMTQANPGAGAGSGSAGAPDLSLPQPELNPDGTPKKPSSPLDAFSDIFTIDSKKTPAKDPMAEPLFAMDPKTLAEQVNKFDFAGQLSPEQFQALSQDPSKMSAFMNGSLRKLYMNMMQVMTGIMEQGIRKNNDRFSSTLDGRFRDFQVNSSTSDNPVLRHPSVQPVLASLRQLISQQQPNLSPAEVNKKAEEWFTQTGKALTSLETDALDDAGKGGGGLPKEQDWSKFAT